MPKPRILVVAGDTQLRATVARWLMTAGYGVEVAESLRHAQEAAANADISLAIVAPDGLGADPAGELAGKVRHVI
jgi:DNA-binding response OmpR family regulator